MKNRIGVVTAALIAATSFASFAQTVAERAEADREEAAAKAFWNETIHKTSAPKAGCFEASYPSTKWVEVECGAPSAYRSAVPDSRLQVVGNGSDFVARAPAGTHFSKVVGSFPTVTGVTSEKSVGVAAFGGGGILGANEYTLQINTNFAHTAACKTFTNCIAWVQYVMSTNTPVSLTSSALTNDTEVFIEYWLIDYGANSRATCPAGFINGGADAQGPGVDCVQNGPSTLIANGQLPITDLSQITMSGSATAGGTDSTTVTFGGRAFTASVSDSLTDIASGWTQAEWNVVGNAGGSRAQFNAGSHITAKLAVTDGSTTAPTCLAPSAIQGTTGETNNLNAGTCTATGGTAPSIQFTESN
jgi:hypothetical protein